MNATQSKPIKIYVVEDDAMYAKAVEKVLTRNEDYEVKTFTSGEDLLQNLDTYPHIFILDFHLKDNTSTTSIDNSMDGGDIMKWLVQNEIEVPVIMFSGLDDVSKAVNLLKYNASDYIVKDDNAFAQLEKSVGKIVSMYNMKEEEAKLSQQKKNLYQRLFVTAVLTLILVLGILMF